MGLQVQKIFSTPLCNKLKQAAGIATVVAGAALCGTSCSESREVHVDNSTLHTIVLGDDTVKMQDGVSFEVNSKIYLMQDGQLWVYRKNKKTWTECKNNTLGGLYDYQTHVFRYAASAKKEVGEDLQVLSKEDLKYWQDNRKEFNGSDRVQSNSPHGGMRRSVHLNKKIKPENGISVSASESSFYVDHWTSRLNILYDMNKESAVKQSEEIENIDLYY